MRYAYILSSGEWDNKHYFKNSSDTFFSCEKKKKKKKKKKKTIYTNIFNAYEEDFLKKILEDC